MRDLTLQETHCLGGGSSAEFNQCMADNWAENTFMGGATGAFVGAVAGGGVLSLEGAVGAGILGAMGASSATGLWCAVTAIF